MHVITVMHYNTTNVPAAVQTKEILNYKILQ